MVWLLRFVLLFLIIFFFYLVLKVLFNASRKLESARKKKQFLLIDHEDVRKNFLLTFKGALFAGEKYMGANEKTFDVVSISIWPQNASLLKGLVKEDFSFIEKKIVEKYPNAKIHWKSPIKEFLQKN